MQQLYGLKCRDMKCLDASLMAMTCFILCGSLSAGVGQ